MTIRAAVIGLGIGEAHAEAYSADLRCELVALCDLSPEKLARAAKRFPGARATQRAEEILTAPDVDVVSIATFDDSHFEMAIRALEHGKHVFVEKPLCRSVGEARALRHAWQRKPRVLASNLVLRSAPLYQWLAAAAARGEFGRLYAFDGDYLYGRIEKITTGWRKDVEQYSVMQGGGIHLVDLMLWITGERPVSAFAVGSRVATAGTSFRYDDMVAATYRFTSGLIGRITANFGCVHPHQHVIRLFGTSATFLYDERGARLHASRDPEASPLPIAFAPEPEQKGSLIPAFIQSILAGTDASSVMQRELDLVSVTVAADKALASGHETPIDYA